MIRIFRAKSAERDFKCDTFQDDKTFAEHITDYLNGNHEMDMSMEGSHDFESMEDVDFNKELPKSNPDIFDVVSGKDKVFPDPVVTTETPVSAESSAPSETNSES